MSALDASRTTRSARRSPWLIGLTSFAAVPIMALALHTIVATPASAQAPARNALPSAGSLPKKASGAGTTTAPSKATTNAPAAKGTTRRTPPPPSSLKVMAVVNGEQISRSDLGYQCLRRYAEDVLESYINQALIREACRQRGIQITSQDIDEEIQRIADKFGLSRDRWLTLLKEERGFTEAQYRQEVVWPMLALRKLTAGDVQVTQEELKRAMETEYGPKVRARLIIVASKEKADQVRAAAAADSRKFGQLAKEHCEDKSVAAAMGVIPPISLHMGEPAIEQAAFRLKKGEVSQVIKIADKYVILYCEDQVEQQYIASQNLPKVQEQLAEKIREAKMRSASAEFFARMQKEAQIVNVYNDPAKRKAQPGVAATINGQPITLEELQEACIERHGADVLDGEINRKILAQELARRRITIDDHDIEAEIARAAESYGIFKPGTTTPDVDRWLKEVTAHDGATIELYRDDAVWPSVALKKLVGGKIEVTDEDLQKAFESSYGERVEVLAIVLGDQRQAQRVWEQARNNPTQAFFEELAEQNSIEPSSRSNRGKVPAIRRHSGGGVIEQEAFKLKAGELSGILAVEDQYIILRCLGRTSPMSVDFASVRDNLYKDIHEKKIRVEMNKEFDRLISTAQIDNYLAGTSQAGRKSASAPGKAAPAATVSSQSKGTTTIKAGAPRPAAPATATSPKVKTTR